MPLPKDYTQGTEFTDLRGSVVKPGATVVYAALSGRSCQLCEATVLDVAVKDRTINKKEGYWQWDRLTYSDEDWWKDPARKYIVTRQWTEVVQDYKVQLRPSGRYGRWSQHNVTDEEGNLKPRWVMAEQAALVL